MMKIVSVAVLGAPVLGDLCNEDSTITAEPLVFSGSPNPQFQLNPEERQAVCIFLSKGAKKIPTCRTVGFVGWRLCLDDKCQDIRGASSLDGRLLDAYKVAHPEMMSGNGAVHKHIAQEIDRLGSKGDVTCVEEDPVPVSSNAVCDGTNHGDDDPKTVHYDDEKDADGCFVSKQTDNNCYDYANDIATNDRAYPGRGSGMCNGDDAPCFDDDLCFDGICHVQRFTCESLRAEAESDKLVWVGTDLPTTLPATGHYVSLHSWPEQDFHWLRMNADGVWSHKPGHGPVRDYDNNQKQITNPHEADLSPWSEHCGYMLATPSLSALNCLSLDCRDCPFLDPRLDCDLFIGCNDWCNHNPFAPTTTQQPPAVIA